MKISQEEIDAAIVAYNGSILTVVGRKQLNGMTAALTAALTVRKARKLAKRERQRKEKDKQVQESAGPVGVLLGIDPFWVKTAPVGDEHIISSKFPPSKAPEWDGTFGVGEWEMRNGRFGKVTNLQCGIAGCYLEGEAESMKWNWELDGRSGSNDDPRDLIRPWPKDNPSDSTGASG